MQGFRIREQGLGSAMRKTVASSAMMAVLVLAGCRQDMHNQPKFVPQRGTTFFADGRSARPQVFYYVVRYDLQYVC